MLTHLKPEIHRIFGTRTDDAFESYGEPTGVRHLCEAGVLRQFGELPALLIPRRIRMTAQYLDD